MKHILIISFIFNMLLMAIPIDKTIDELLSSEQKKALQISKYDPFKRAMPLLIRKSTKTGITAPKPLEVIAVMNSKAFINNHWYKKGDNLFQGKITKISKQSVHIQKGTRTIVLRMKKGEKLLKIRQKDNQ